jgi:lysylphosphatidylglycerol synthetase-like protein (DUF2156 family)
MTNRPLSVSAALILILLNALVWLALGVIIAANVHPALPDQPLIKGVMAFLALATAGILLGLFIFLGRHSRVAYFIALGLLIATSLLSILDEFGLADLVFLAINIAPIILLIKDRTWYLQMRSRAVESN